MEIILIIVIGCPAVIFGYVITKQDMRDVVVRDGRIAPYEFKSRADYRAALKAHKSSQKGGWEG